MVFQVKRSLSTTGVILNLIKSAILFLSLFLVCELSVTVEAKSVATSTYKNVTILSKTRRYLTIGTQGITGETSNGPYAKLQIHTVGFNGEITIKSAKTGKYLSMNSNGKVFLVGSETKETVFIDVRKITSPFVSIRSKPYPLRYLDVSGTGSVTGSTNTNGDSTKFVYF